MQDLTFISTKTPILVEVFNLFDSRGLTRIDLFEVLVVLALSTQSDLDDKLQILFETFSFENNEPALTYEQFCLFFDCFFRAIFKVVLKEGETFYPTYQNRRLAFSEIENVAL